ncbi:2'-5' RNA ligase [Nocardioides scoriae]|uniref:RNA 2',3'-cyclic phosphodiesterase n=1 Tax=Nocardioides scoriae TaxID=642780 RepID=A0A1H1W4K1_9ACTN|nr:RNA 2',3'-cyclic phosphodiesterase [Nocardioides scoriae]SDS91964.1 2'-5' RNA ligase [Nocardioides scoriae]
MRLFVAVLPPVEAVEHLEEFLEPRREHGDFRWSPPDQAHVTLAFLPDVAEHLLDELGERLATAASRRRPLVARIAGGGAFPDVARGRLLHAGLDLGGEAGDDEELDRTATGARHAAVAAGTEVDGARFRPHVTLARLRRPADLTRWVRVLDTYAGPSWPLDELALVASYLGEGPRRRARHEVLATFPLGGREGRRAQSRPRP